MRKYFSEKFGLGVITEIHASELIRISKIKQYKKITKTNRLNILKEYATFIPSIFGQAKLINICLKKSNHPNTSDFCLLAYNRLINRYESFLIRTAKDEGMIIADDSSEIKLRNLLRKMRIYNPTPSSRSESSYNFKITRVIEDMVHRRSHTSYFIQTVDVIAYLLKSKEFPKGSTKKYNLDKLFDKLLPIIHKPASPRDQFGIVRN